MSLICTISVLLCVVVVSISATAGAEGKPSKLSGPLAQLKNRLEQNAASRANRRIALDTASQSRGEADGEAEARRMKRYLPFIFGGKCNTFGCSNSGSSKPRKYGSKGFDSDRYGSEKDDYGNYDNSYYDSSGDPYDYYNYYYDYDDSY